MNADVQYTINAPDVFLESICDETLVVSFITGNYYCLSAVAGRILNLIKAGMSQQAIVDTISASCDDAPDMLADIVKSFLWSLEKEQIIKAVPKKVGQSPETAVFPPMPFEIPYLEIYEDARDLLM